MQMTPHVLVVEDEDSLATLLQYNLQKEGYEVSLAGDGEEALVMVDERLPDLIVLDWMLPKVSGIEVCRRLRQRNETRNVPIIMLTARGEETDRVRGLDTGADDYVVKPFSPKELVARVRAVLRRSRPGPAAPPLAFGALVVDVGTHQVFVGGEPVTLTPKEFDLLRALAEAQGRVLSREFLLDRVWGYTRSGEIESRTVDVHVRRLRMKLGAEGMRIRTVKSVGYRFDPGTP